MSGLAELPTDSAANPVTETGQGDQLPEAPEQTIHYDRGRSRATY